MVENGKIIDSLKYSTNIFGSGSIIQDDAIISSGNTKDGVLWNVLHTNKKIDFSKDFTVSVDVNLTSSIARGDAMAILSIESMASITAGKMPERNFCELTKGQFHGLTLRMRRSGHGTQIKTPAPAGKFTISYDAGREALSCRFGDEKYGYVEVSEEERRDFSEFFGVLRAGIHDITSGGIEKPTEGSFTVVYDNLDVKP
jgi:hypothetical protein